MASSTDMPDRHYLEKRSPTQIGEILKGVVRGRRLHLRSRYAELFETWNEVVGQEAKEHTRVQGFQAGVLHVRVDAAPWLHELECFQKSKLIMALQQRVEAVYVRDIKFSLGNLSESE